MSLLTKTTRDKMIAFKKELEELYISSKLKYKFYLFVTLDSYNTEIFLLERVSDYGIKEQLGAPTIYQLHHQLEQWLEKEKQKNENP